MKETLNSKKGLLVWGGLLGAVAVWLAIMGNPGNMAFCIACFIRDIAGAAKLHTAPIVQYMRPEIAGLIAGAFIISMATGEYRSTAGSSPMIRFLLGIITISGMSIAHGHPYGRRRSECLYGTDWFCAGCRHRLYLFEKGLQSGTIL